MNEIVLSFQFCTIIHVRAAVELRYDHPTWIVRVDAMMMLGKTIVTTPGRRMIARRLALNEIQRQRVTSEGRVPMVDFVPKFYCT